MKAVSVAGLQRTIPLCCIQGTEIKVGMALKVMLRGGDAR